MGILGVAGTSVHVSALTIFELKKADFIALCHKKEGSSAFSSKKRLHFENFLQYCKMLN